MDRERKGMLTVILAWINAKYEWTYEFLFLFTFALDIILIYNYFYAK